MPPASCKLAFTKRGTRLHATSNLQGENGTTPNHCRNSGRNPGDVANLTHSICCTYESSTPLQKWHTGLNQHVSYVEAPWLLTHLLLSTYIGSHSVCRRGNLQIWQAFKLQHSLILLTQSAAAFCSSILPVLSSCCTTLEQ
jgi:hypothetical protein